MHECPDAEVGQEQTVEILTGQVRDAAAKHDARATETGLQFGQDCFDGPPLGVKIGQLNRRRFARIQNRAEKAVLFSAFAEEHGFVGVVVVLSLYFVLVMRIVQNAQTAPDRVGMYICMGVAALLLFHILVNVGMVAGLMPVTGIPLPFMSFGGSSIWTFFLALGLVNNVRLRRFVN